MDNPLELESEENPGSADHSLFRNLNQAQGWVLYAVRMNQAKKKYLIQCGKKNIKYGNKNII